LVAARTLTDGRLPAGAFGLGYLRDTPRLLAAIAALGVRLFRYDGSVV
jgi:hypothetical protein